MAELLLHSLAEFREIIFGCLDAAGARRVVEIGSEEATFTGELLAWVEERGGTVQCVEPEPSPRLREMARGSPALRVIEARSPGALDQIEPADAYLVDGDHNYRTVLDELGTIARRSGERGADFVVVLHDIGWPCGRRDMYYAPKSLPPEAVHPFTYEQGVIVGRSAVVDGGHRGEGSFAWALEEGGEANGVLTAVEDFLDGRDDLAFVEIPCIFGLGIVYPRSAPFAERLQELLAVYDGNALLGRLEQNRLALYLRVLELQDEKEQVIQGLEDTRLRLRDVAAENRALWARTAELEAQVGRLTQGIADMKAELVALANSRAFAVAERLSRARSRAKGDGPGLSRQRLQETLERQRA